MPHRRILGSSGNSITVTLPRDMLDQVKLSKGDQVQLTYQGRNGILIRPDKTVRPGSWRKLPAKSVH